MDRKREMRCRVSILNKFGATHPSITGKSAKELADFLYRNEVDVRMISIKATYKGKSANESLKLPYPLVELNGIYNGTNKYLRLLVNLLDGFRIVTSSLWGRKDDVKIVMTDPSLINMWAILLKPFYHSKLVFWTMDLYPDAFCSAGLVCKNNKLYCILSSIIYRFPPDYLIALGKQQYQYLSKKYEIEIPYTLLPCGINHITKSGEVPWWRKKYQDKIVLCYAGNLGEAHDDCFLLNLIAHINPLHHVVLLVLYGAKSEKILQAVNDNCGVVLLDYILPEQLVFVDVNIASLLSNWNHVCVPSKVVSAICAGSPVLYNASNESEGYCMFKDALWLIPETEDYSTKSKYFLDNLNKKEIEQKRKKTLDYAKCLHRMRDKAFGDILNYCSNSN